MKGEILENINNPRQLEKLYRDNKATFKREFNLIFDDIQHNASAQFWNQRLNFENEEISWGSKDELAFIIIASIIAGVIAKIPNFTPVPFEVFYMRNIGFIVFPLLTLYFAWRQKVQEKTKFIAIGAILLSFIYINLLPDDLSSDTLDLACIHLPLFLWSVLGYTFVGNQFKNHQKRLDFLRYNGDLAVMTAILLIGGALLTVISLGLFSLIDLRVEEFYFQYIVVWGLAASPIVGTYLVQTNPQLVNKVSPVVAKVFTPLLLLTLVIYLLAVIATGKDPYNDRDFLLIFNALLIGVMAIILFSVAETTKNADSKIGSLLLLGLSIVTVIVNGIALSAILFRISEWGITPNRLAVMGGNLLILNNLLMVTFRLFQSIRSNSDTSKVESSIASFLPIYSVWTIVVIFIFPVIFAFR